MTSIIDFVFQTPISVSKYMQCASYSLVLLLDFLSPNMIHINKIENPDIAHCMSEHIEWHSSHPSALNGYVMQLYQSIALVNAGDNQMIVMAAKSEYRKASMFHLSIC